MGEVLGKLADGSFHRFETLFNAEEGRIGVVVTFLSMLELAKEQLLEIVQEAPRWRRSTCKSLAAGADQRSLRRSPATDQRVRRRAARADFR